MNFHYSWQLKCTLRHSQISPFRKGCSSAAIGSWQHTALPASCRASRNAADGSVCVLASSTPCHSLHVTRSKTTADKPRDAETKNNGLEAKPHQKLSSIRPTEPFILTGSINRVPTCPVGVKAGRSPLSGGR